MVLIMLMAATNQVQRILCAVIDTLRADFVNKYSENSIHRRIVPHNGHREGAEIRKTIFKALFSHC